MTKICMKNYSKEEKRQIILDYVYDIYEKEQRFVSQSKLSCIEFFIAKTAGFKCKRWSGCQMLICEPAA